jgi:hypothetical protein
MNCKDFLAPGTMATRAFRLDRLEHAAKFSTWIGEVSHIGRSAAAAVMLR